MRPARSRKLLPAALLLTFLSALPAAAGVRVSFSVSGDTLAGLVDGVRADLSCDPDLSAAGRAAWDEVVREGEDGAASFRDDDGRPVAFRRERHTFRIVTRDSEEREVRLEIPWGLARCLLGGEPPAPHAARALRGDELRFELTVDDEQVELVVSQLPSR